MTLSPKFALESSCSVLIFYSPQIDSGISVFSTGNGDLRPVVDGVVVVAIYHRPLAKHNTKTINGS